jgi:hypothetical protein
MGLLEISECLKQAMTIRGAWGASLIDVTSGLTIGSTGRHPSGDDRSLGAGAAELVRATVANAAFTSVGEPSRLEDLVITSSDGFHVIQFAPSGSVVLYVWLDPVEGNLAITKRSLRLIAREL